MDLIPGYPPSLDERMNSLWRSGVRLATRLAIAFGLSVVAAILIGAAVTDNGFVQIIVTVLAAFGLWIPFAVLLAGLQRLFTGRRSRRSEGAALGMTSSSDHEKGWRRLAAVAPGHSARVAVLQRSLERSRLALGQADLDPDAHDLCVLIDRRLPDLIHHELDNLAPDDRNRRRQIGELIDLIEQFARHCSRKRSADGTIPGHEAAVLRRRFEDHMSDPWERPQ